MDLKSRSIFLQRQNKSEAFHVNVIWQGALAESDYGKSTATNGQTDRQADAQLSLLPGLLGLVGSQQQGGDV